MRFYKVFEQSTYHYGYCLDEEDVKYYLSKILAEEDLRKRRDEWSHCPARIEEIKTED